MEDVTIKSGSTVYTSIIDSDAFVGEGASVGMENAGKDNITVIAKNTQIAPSSKVTN